MDQPESTSKNIRKILSDISRNLQTKMETLKKDVLELKRMQQEQARDFSMQSSALLGVFEDVSRESQALTTKKAMLRKSLEKEEADLARLERENQEFQKQADNLEALNRGLRERSEEVEEKHRMLQQKLRQLREKAELKENEHRETNIAYKKYLGLEIAKVKDNVVKISYGNLGHECYIILDFTTGDCVAESQPEVNIEKLNYLFKEKKNFYEFVKRVRDQLKQRL